MENGRKKNEKRKKNKQQQTEKRSETNTKMFYYSLCTTTVGCRVVGCRLSVIIIIHLNIDGAFTLTSNDNSHDDFVPKTSVSFALAQEIGPQKRLFHILGEKWYRILCEIRDYGAIFRSFVCDQVTMNDENVCCFAAYRYLQLFIIIIICQAGLECTWKFFSLKKSNRKFSIVVFPQNNTNNTNIYSCKLFA